jgi:YHS domain-containing protein
MAISIDPICKMEVDTKNPPGGNSEYQGEIYYFCAPGCKLAFDQDPDKYLSAETEAPIQQEKRPSLLARLFGRGR